MTRFQRIRHQYRFRFRLFSFFMRHQRSQFNPFSTWLSYRIITWLAYKLDIVATSSPSKLFFKDYQLMNRLDQTIEYGWEIFDTDHRAKKIKSKFMRRYLRQLVWDEGIAKL